MIEKLKQNKLVLIIFIMAILLIITGVTYSFYKIKLEGQKTHFVSSDLISFTYKESENKIAITNMTPVSDTDGKKSNYFEFSVSSNLVKDMSVDYEISILKTSTTNSFNESDIKVYLTDENNNSLVEPVIISELEDNSKITNAKTIYQNNFTYNNSNEKQTHTYRLRIWLKNDVDLSKYTTKTETENGTNVTLENHIFKFKVNVNTYESGAANTLIALTDNKDNSGLYTITHAKDSTLQIGTNESITEYRYRGASPKNYVTFNGETWRILGVFPVDDGTGKIENRIKIVRNENIGNKIWNASQSNNWARPATLNTELNGTYLNSLTREAQSMIGDAKYYLGGKTPTSNNGYTDTPLQFYSYERKTKNTTSNEFYYGTYPNSWVGKLSLMYVSDYGYASSNCENKRIYGDNDIRGCNNTNWLYNIKIDEWLLPQYAGSNGYTFLIGSAGLIDYRIVNTFEGGVRPVLYLISSVQITGGDGTSTDPYVLGINQKDTSGANAPVLASNMIPVYYDEAKNVWKCADKENKDIITRWYHYDYSMWANAVTINYSDSSIKNKYFNSDGTLKIKPGEEVLMDDITTMWVWIPRFNAVTPSNYNGGTQAKPNAIDVTFVKQNEVAIDAFTFGDKELSGFWYGKFEISHTTLASSTTANSLGCTNETCSNANGIIVKPNVTSLRWNNPSNFFFASRSMEQTGNSFGFVSSEVDTHMSKNNEWGAVAYLTQSIYGRCTSSSTCTEIGINNSGYITGYGAPAGSSSSVTNGAYNTALGKDASTTGTIYGIYDMSGGAVEYVMGVYNNTKGSYSGFSSLPDTKYYNNYTGSSYTGHALTETNGWYSDEAYFVSTSYPWFKRGGDYSNSTRAGVFYFSGQNGDYSTYFSSHLVISNK